MYCGMIIALTYNVTIGWQSWVMWRSTSPRLLPAKQSLYLVCDIPSTLDWWVFDNRTSDWCICRCLETTIEHLMHTYIVHVWNNVLQCRCDKVFLLSNYMLRLSLWFESTLILRAGGGKDWSFGLPRKAPEQTGIKSTALYCILKII